MSRLYKQRIDKLPSIYGIRLVGKQGNVGSLTAPSLPCSQLTFHFDDSTGLDGWQKNYSGYAFDDPENIYDPDYTNELVSLPFPLNSNKKSIRLKINNVSSSSFSYIFKQVTLAPDSAYELLFFIEVATNISKTYSDEQKLFNNFTTIKVGASNLEEISTFPVGIPSFYQTNFDEGSDPRSSGSDMILVNDISNNLEDSAFSLVTLTSTKFPITTDKNGNAWLLIGLHSTCNLPLELYINKIHVLVYCVGSSVPVLPTPTPSITSGLPPTPTPSVTEGLTPTPTLTPSVTPGLPPTPTVTENLSPTPTPSVTEGLSPTPTPTVTPTPTYVFSAGANDKFNVTYDLSASSSNLGDLITNLPPNAEYVNVQYLLDGSTVIASSDLFEINGFAAASVNFDVVGNLTPNYGYISKIPILASSLVGYDLYGNITVSNGTTLRDDNSAPQKNKARASIKIEGTAKSDGGPSGPNVPIGDRVDPNANKVSVGVLLEGKASGGSANGDEYPLAIEPEEVSVALNLLGSSTRYSSIPITVDSETVTFTFNLSGISKLAIEQQLENYGSEEKCSTSFDMNGESKKSVEQKLISPPPETVTKVTFDVDGNVSPSAPSPVSVKAEKITNVTFNIEGSSTNISGPYSLPATSWLFYAPIGQTGVGTTEFSDYVTLTPAKLLYFKVWDRITYSYVSVLFEDFIARRLNASDRIVEYKQHIALPPAQEIDLTFPQAEGQTATTIGLFYAHKIGGPTITKVLNPISGDLYDVIPQGGAIKTTLPDWSLTYGSNDYVIYRLLIQSPGTMLTIQAITT